MSGKLKVLLIKPNEAPLPTEIGSELKDLQTAIGGGYIEIHSIDDNNTVIVCDEDGKNKRLAGNRKVGADIIAGTFFICGRMLTDDGYDLCSISNEQQAFYSELFKNPEVITQAEVEETAKITFILW